MERAESARAAIGVGESECAPTSVVDIGARVFVVVAVLISFYHDTVAELDVETVVGLLQCR